MKDICKFCKFWEPVSRNDLADKDGFCKNLMNILETRKEKPGVELYTIHVLNEESTILLTKDWFSCNYFKATDF
jgi:hypothetical protein